MPQLRGNEPILGLNTATCMYCHTTNHDIEDCTGLLGNIQK
jgi:hypothetical protein